ncbi:MSHA biogenesis protein MshA [Veronia nyctiphanis]|uniref:MSHA biogenesis protein MshA n=1 Tax=Veronia nyctiphanis TaxID=1278244 RepID=A0A4Q0YPN3_9GAMM|nr:type II secretion system protein [Veronia nyctiphanis]RXJ71944.1 MSHA biogenesis protein MshA [Veronia nyctiphanis]
MKQLKGFTLIEMVAVMVMLSLLAVMAAPKLINMREDAELAVLQGLKAAVDGAILTVSSKVILAGLEDNVGTQKVNGIDLYKGYPSVSESGIGVAVGINDGDDWEFDGTTINHPEIKIRAANQVSKYCLIYRGVPLAGSKQPNLPPSSRIVEDCGAITTS